MAKRRRVKVRITTWVDRDVLMWMKVRALETRMGYQTLMNRMLQESIARADREAHAPPPVSRNEYESVLSTLSELESRLEGLKEQVQTSAASNESPSRRGRMKKKPRAVRARRAKPKTSRKPPQRRFSQNSTS